MLAQGLPPVGFATALQTLYGLGSPRQLPTHLLWWAWRKVRQGIQRGPAEVAAGSGGR
jgi:hypothetical protein